MERSRIIIPAEKIIIVTFIFNLPYMCYIIEVIALDDNIAII